MLIHHLFHVFMCSLYVSVAMGFQTSCIRALRAVTDLSDPSHWDSHQQKWGQGSLKLRPGQPILAVGVPMHSLASELASELASWVCLGSMFQGGLFSRKVPWTYTAPYLRFGRLGGLCTHVATLSPLLSLALSPFAPDFLERSQPWIISWHAWTVNNACYQLWALPTVLTHSRIVPH